MGDFHVEERVPTIITLIFTKEIVPDIRSLLQKRKEGNELFDSSDRPGHVIQIFEFLDELNLEIEPLHPDVDDEELTPYFVIAMPNDMDTLRILSRLQLLNGIEGAYIKGPEGPAF